MPTIEISGLCNLNCVFCAYKEKGAGKTVMSTEDFASYVNQMAAMGYRELSLTPQTGDVFIDKNLTDKIDVLEDHPGIEAYEFITNLVGATPKALTRLSKARKLTRMYISLYGHDVEGFQNITKRPALQHQRLVENIRQLTQLAKHFTAQIGSFVMTDRDFVWSPFAPPRNDDTELMVAMRELAEKAKNFFWSGNHVDFDSWGGRITQQELDDLDKGFQLVGPTVPMTGPCGMLFGGFVVLADGGVNACACRAVGESLLIGNATTTPIKDIVSPDNPRYIQILDAHRRDVYPAACVNCKIFSSVYRRPHRRETVSVDEYLAKMRLRCK